MFYFYAHEFLTFSGGIEMEHWAKMGQFGVFIDDFVQVFIIGIQLHYTLRCKLQYCSQKVRSKYFIVAHI